MAKILNGIELSKQMRDMVSEMCCQYELKNKGRTVGLAIVQVGDNPSATSYVKNNLRLCKEVGITAYHHKLSVKATVDEIKDVIKQLNNDDKVSGILLQLPLPEGIDVKEVSCVIDPKKDVDGLNPVSAGNLYYGFPAFAPCTPSGVLELLKSTRVEFPGKHVVIVGASNIVGKPLAMLMMREQATVTICNIYTKNLAEICKQADILISAAGKAELITKDHVKPGAIVIDVGINFKDKKLVGDVKFDEVAEVAEWITPVPGGVGPMTVTMLMFNTYAAAIESKESK
ncbi:MAG: bifunctional 5,10-methylenetetrahydrofolate dehydrogenase/5,10-methenyltetrahydrofolate cyclohydrolase [Clostridia bacterium]|nr:bifunctional 5,10-methylenetetrahydrofolate dehydrogenase/5,10-methenyltetrahydrofolate cyclohydrolase [Clostridia bacterium]